jgi:S1-C subfamily serine protease
VLEYNETLDNSSQGTAFLLDGVGLVTAHHVLAKMTCPWAEIYLAIDPSRKFKARFSGRVCAHRDLAILEHDLPIEDQIFLKPSAGVDRIKSAVTAIGYPEFGHGDGLVHKEGRIVGRNVKSLVRYVEVDIQLGDGLSGGPIINERYEVVGVVHKGGPLESKQLGVDVVETATL